jgi:hypothetical protein
MEIRESIQNIMQRDTTLSLEVRSIFEGLSENVLEHVKILPGCAVHPNYRPQHFSEFNNATLSHKQ